MIAAALAEWRLSLTVAAFVALAVWLETLDADNRRKR